VYIDWLISSGGAEADDPMARITELLRSIPSSHLEGIHATVVGYMPPPRAETDWSILHSLITKRRWAENAELPRVSVTVDWEWGLDAHRLSRQHVKLIQGRLSKLIDDNLLSFWCEEGDEDDEGNQDLA
jgi:hypothetical protein